MNKKLILLLLILPLVLMFSIFTTTNSVGLEIKAPVSSIEILGNKMVYLDYDEKEKYFVNYTVYPLTAANKKVVFSTEQVGTGRLAQLDFEDGYIVPKSIGSAKVYLSTVDGGFKDSFIVQVDSSKVQEINCTVAKTQLMVGETVNINTTFVPENAINKILTYTSSDLSVATVDSKGKIKAVGKGVAEIVVTPEGNEDAKKSITIEVFNQDIMDIAQTEVYTYMPEGSVNISIDTDENYTLSYEVYNLGGTQIFDAFEGVDTGFVTQPNGSVVFNYKFVSSFYGSVVVKFTITTDNPSRLPLVKNCVLNRVDAISASFDSNEVLSFTAGALFALHNKISVTPENTDVRYEVNLSNDNIIANEVSSRIRLTAIKPGVTTLTLKVINNTPPYQTITLTKEIVVLPTSLEIAEYANSYGIEDLWTVGKYEADGSLSASKVSLSFGKTDCGTNFMEHFVFETNNNKVSVSKDGLISISDDSFTGIVEIVGKFEYENILLKTTSFLVRCVGNGTNIRNFYDLYTATRNNKIVVLQKSIQDDFGKDKNGNDVYTEATVDKITSTYDLTHYKNIDKLDSAKVKVLLSFKKDVYGNGYSINAHNVAYGLDSVGKLKDNALFKGPLNFVSMSESSSSLVSVKAQDNISFAAYENVTLNNVVLSSCNISADTEGNYDLTDLTYVGTTVEVLGDNVNIEYCRLNNGRTVLRAFGDIQDKNKVINVNIKNSVLSSAREFIVRMGTNAFVDGSVENPSPYIDGVSQAFPAQKSYDSMSATEKTTYENKYIKTFVNIQNSILKDAGLFCVGIDAHFSGGALANGTGLAGGLVDSWYDLAKTSYGAKLTFIDDVRMYDWKNIEQIDSSTLIEVVGGSSYGDLSFDVRELIESLANNTTNTRLNTIVHTQDGKKYVHGGIAFFGGGKNYGVFEAKGAHSMYKNLNGYEVSLGDVNKIELQIAAGEESFYFLLNDATTQGFLPDDQARILASNDAYAPIYIKN